MVKKKTSKKQTASSKNIQPLQLKDNSLIQTFSPTDQMLDKDFIGKAILECLEKNDPQGVIEVITTYLKTVNKVKAAQSAGIARSTLYHSLKGKNPTIKTLAKIVHSTSAELKK